MTSERLVNHKPKIAASWPDGQKILSQSPNLMITIAIRLQLYSAFRHGEIFGSDDETHGHLKPLTRKNIDLDNNRILIYGKGGTIIYQPIDSATADLIRQYIAKKKIGMSQPLFKITSRHYRGIIKKLARQADIDHWQLFSSHTLRAISITYVCHKKDIGAARVHARHSSIRTTAGYDRPTDEMREETFRSIFET